MQSYLPGGASVHTCSHVSTPNGICITSCALIYNDIWASCNICNRIRQVAPVCTLWPWVLWVYTQRRLHYFVMVQMRPWCRYRIMQTEYWSNSTTPNASAIKYSDEYLISRSTCLILHAVTHFRKFCEIKWILTWHRRSPKTIGSD